MPVIPPAAGAAIGAAGNVAGGIINTLSSLGTTVVQAGLNKKAYERQRDDAIAFWNTQNEYNSPAKQMERYKAAGLNPNLIYGQSNTSGPIQQPDLRPATAFDPRPGDFMASQAGSVISQMYDLEIKDAQVDNLKAQNAVIQQEAILKAITAERKKFDLGLESELRGTSVDYRREKLRQTKVQIDYSLDENARRAVLTTSNLEQAAEKMLLMQEQRLSMAQQRKQSQAEIRRINEDVIRMRTQVELLKKDGVLKDLDIRLRKDGLNPSDPTYVRMVSQWLTNMLEGDDLSGGIFNFLFK